MTSIEFTLEERNTLVVDRVDVGGVPSPREIGAAEGSVVDVGGDVIG